MKWFFFCEESKYSASLEFFEIKKKYNFCADSIGCFFKFILKLSVEESIVNAPRITDLITDQLFKSNLTFCVVCFYCGDWRVIVTFTIDSSTPTLMIHLNEHPIQGHKMKHLKNLYKTIWQIEAATKGLVE
jgi:hypothetical protein